MVTGLPCESRDWSKKAQVPPQIVATSNDVEGAVDTVNELVAALGAGEVTAVTVVFAENTPVPERIAILVCGFVTAGILSVAGR